MTAPPDGRDVQGLIFDVDTFAIHDGPGIRMAVYFKGCPLACAWCHSPESRRPSPELIYVRHRCVACSACVQACERGVHELDGATHRIHRDRCEMCGRCVEHCPAGALAVKGYRIEAAEVVARATRLKPFFDHSGGGVTLTGGEVTGQPEFAAAVLDGCRALGIHTAVETCGACDWDRLESVVSRADLVLYDLKLVDDDAHRKWTGVSNQRILDNAARLNGRDVQVRVPLIPDITDTADNLQGIFEFMNRAGLTAVALLPYNAAAAAKYDWLDLPYPIHAQPQDATHLDALVVMATEAGLSAVIG